MSASQHLTQWISPLLNSCCALTNPLICTSGTGCFRCSICDTHAEVAAWVWQQSATTELMACGNWQEDMSSERSPAWVPTLGIHTYAHSTAHSSCAVCCYVQGPHSHAYKLTCSSCIVDTLAMYYISHCPLDNHWRCHAVYHLSQLGMSPVHTSAWIWSMDYTTVQCLFHECVLCWNKWITVWP